LFHQPRGARLDLVFLGIAVAGRSALEHVGDVDLFPRHADPGEHPREELARRADERLTLSVLVHTRRFPDEQEVGVGVAHAEHDLGPRLGEPALRTGRGLDGDVGERSRHEVPPTYARGTRAPIRVTISQAIVFAWPASSHASIDSSPWRPSRTTSSPVSTGSSPQSTSSWSIVTLPTTRQRRPRINTSARDELARG